MKLDYNKLDQRIAELEGQRINLPIAQISEARRCTMVALAEYISAHCNMSEVITALELWPDFAAAMIVMQELRSAYLEQKHERSNENL